MAKKQKNSSSAESPSKRRVDDSSSELVNMEVTVHWRRTSTSDQGSVQSSASLAARSTLSKESREKVNKKKRSLVNASVARKRPVGEGISKFSDRGENNLYKHHQNKKIRSSPNSYTGLSNDHNNEKINKSSKYKQQKGNSSSSGSISQFKMRKGGVGEIYQHKFNNLLSKECIELKETVVDHSKHVPVKINDPFAYRFIKNCLVTCYVSDVQLHNHICWLVMKMKGETQYTVK